MLPWRSVVHSGPGRGGRFLILFLLLVLGAHHRPRLLLLAW